MSNKNLPWLCVLALFVSLVAIRFFGEAEVAKAKAELAEVEASMPALLESRDVAVREVATLRARLDERDALLVEQAKDWQAERDSLQEQAHVARERFGRLESSLRASVPLATQPLVDSLVASHTAEVDALTSEITTLRLENAELWAYRDDARETILSLDTALRASKAVETQQARVNEALRGVIAGQSREKVALTTVGLVAIAVAVLK